ncbi:unnamed protein product [Sympodiomycopsis kandeliae]
MSAPTTSIPSGEDKLAPPHLGDAQCPVPHASTQPLPPGHPPVSSLPSSSLKPPTDARCIFYRTREDLIATPPLSRQASSIKAAELAKANINPLKEGQAKDLDPNNSLVIASRASQLALVQSSQISAILSANYGHESPAFKTGDSSTSSKLNDDTPLTEEELQDLRERIERLHVKEAMTFPITSMTTTGDKNLSPLYVIGGEGRAIWTGELEVALAAGAIDAVVHSLKDVPTSLPDSFVLGAISEREDPRDALVVKSGLPYKTLDDLPHGSVIGTSSVRRVAQLRARYPGLVFSDVRGNINTRIAKLDAPTGPYTALVLAAAGLIRINVAHRITAYLSRPVLLHAVGQGSLGIEVRKPPPGATPENNRDARILEIIRSVGDWRATARAEAERSLLRELEGGCSIPVGVETSFEDHDAVEGVRNEKVEIAETIECTDGHTITKAAAGESSSKSKPARPATLERLATGNATTDDLLPPAPTEGNASLSSTAATDESSIMALLKPARAEDRSQPPKEPILFHMTASVTSLDGSKSCIHSLSRKIHSVEDAQRIGIEVAKELADRKGAREILDEVHRHRQLAEEADNKRREEARKRRKLQQEQAQENGSVGGEQLRKDAILNKADANVLVSTSAYSDQDRNGGTATPMGEEENKAQQEGWRKLEEVVSKSTNSNGDPLGYYPQTNGELDRRGQPRSDGQEKVWEV